MDLTERAAYIQGMSEALRLEHGDDRDRLLREIAHGFTAIAREIADINEELDQIALAESEGRLVAVRCAGCGEELAVDEDLLEDPDVEVSCPNCGHDLAGRGDQAGREGGRQKAGAHSQKS